MPELTINKDSLVTIRVRMSDLQGNLLEETPEEGVAYLHGHADIFPKIEAALEGLKKGDKASVRLEPEDAFGEFDPDAVFVTDVEKLGDPETIVPGLVFDHVPGEANDGRHYRVTDVADGKEAVGTDDTVVPSFLGFADKIIDEGDDEDDASEESPEPVTRH